MIDIRNMNSGLFTQSEAGCESDITVFNRSSVNEVLMFSIWYVEAV